MLLATLPEQCNPIGTAAKPRLIMVMDDRRGIGEGLETELRKDRHDCDEPQREIHSFSDFKPILLP